MSYYLLLFTLLFFLCPICLTEECENISDISGEIANSDVDSSIRSKCWTIEVPPYSYLKLDIDYTFEGYDCSEANLEVNVIQKTLEHYEVRYCSASRNQEPMVSFGDVTIKYYNARIRETSRNPYYSRYHAASFRVVYSIESLICIQRAHFRCSPNECIQRSQMCNGVKDCKNGNDEISCGIAGVEGFRQSHRQSTEWLQRKRLPSIGWGKDTPRAVTAFFLSKLEMFFYENLEKEVIVKQMELQLSLALLRNSTDPISVNELGMFVNALLVSCLNPRNFYGHDLLQILGERASVLNPPSPSAYLALCNSKWKFTESDVERVFKSLQPPSKYPISLGVEALAFMAISCIKKEEPHLVSSDRISLYEETKKKFIAAQLSDGSFGNVYTTALVTQALISSGHGVNENWNVTATGHYLIKQLNSSSVDFLSTYLTLPTFTGQSLVDVSTVNCSNVKHGGDNDISDVTNKLGDRMRVQYSLYVGNQKDVIHTIILRMPEDSTAYDMMRVAQVEDPKYKFHHQDNSGKMYVYDIAGITNDPEAGKFWLLYLEDRHENGTLKLSAESPSELVLGDEDHLIMWYKTPDM